MEPPAPDGRIADAAERLGEIALHTGWTVSVAESLTGGAIASALVGVPGSGEWFVGGVVAYMSRVKHSLLAVRAEHVISAEAAREMARGVSRLLHTDIGVATTGCAGPEPMEGEPVGSTWISVAMRGHAVARHHCFAGDPGEVRQSATVAAMELASQVLLGEDRLP